MVIMKWLVFLFLAALITADTTTTTVSPTTTFVWATGTNSLGVTVTTESAFTQTTRAANTDASTPLSASIGLGSILGTVGVERTYSTGNVNLGNGLAMNWIDSLILFVIWGLLL